MHGLLHRQAPRYGAGLNRGAAQSPAKLTAGNLFLKMNPGHQSHPPGHRGRQETYRDPRSRKAEPPSLCCCITWLGRQRSRETSHQAAVTLELEARLVLGDQVAHEGR